MRSANCPTTKISTTEVKRIDQYANMPRAAILAGYEAVLELA